MVKILLPFMGIAIIGFIFSVFAHISGFLGIETPFGISLFPLHFGVFIVWFPAVIVSWKSTGFGLRFRWSHWKEQLSGCPKWMITGFYSMFAYAMVSFIAFTSAPDSWGSWVNSTIRGFSGHWMIFYYAAFALMYSAYQKSNKPTEE